MTNVEEHLEVESTQPSQPLSELQDCKDTGVNPGAMALQVVVKQILLGLIAAVGCLVGGTVLLPSLATDELREVLADIIQKCGHSISGYASRVFPPEQVSLSHSWSSFGVVFFQSNNLCAALSMCMIDERMVQLWQGILFFWLVALARCCTDRGRQKNQCKLSCQYVEGVSSNTLGGNVLPWTAFIYFGRHTQQSPGLGGVIVNNSLVWSKFASITVVW